MPVGNPSMRLESGRGNREIRDLQFLAHAATLPAPKAVRSPAPLRRRSNLPQPIQTDPLPQLLGYEGVLELLQRLVLDLADPLARDIERATDLVERARILAAQPIAQLEHAPLAVAEVLERVSQGFIGEDLHGPVVGRVGSFVGDELAELGLLLATDRLLERDRRLG